MIIEIALIIGLLVTISICVYWIYRSGRGTQAALDSLGALNEKQKIVEEAKKKWNEDVDRIAARREYARKWLLDEIHEREVPPTRKSLL